MRTVVAQEVWAVHKICEQVRKLLLINRCGENTPREDAPYYSLLANMTWDEDGELSID